MKLGRTGFDIAVGPLSLTFRRGRMPGGRRGWYASFSMWFKKTAYWFGYYSYLKSSEWRIKKNLGVVFRSNPPTIQTVSFGNFRMTKIVRENAKES